MARIGWRTYSRVQNACYWIINLLDRQIEVYTQPSGPTAAPAHGQQTSYRAGDAVPLILDGATAATIAGQELHLVEVAGFTPSPFEAEFGRHIALAFPRAEFAALKRRLVAHGAVLIEPERATPFERFFFRDLNGYVFEVVDAGRKPEV